YQELGEGAAPDSETHEIIARRQQPEANASKEIRNDKRESSADGGHQRFRAHKRGRQYNCPSGKVGRHLSSNRYDRYGQRIKRRRSIVSKKKS
ncbi:hypothetical protein BGZ65_005815, partial [Modicella reniformis]